MVNKKAQYKIQQLSLLLIAVFILFVFVGLFFLSWNSQDLTEKASQLKQDKALSSLKIIADSTELNCNKNKEWCIDKDKIKLLSLNKNLQLISIFSSLELLEVLIIYPSNTTLTVCPSPNCNYYKIYNTNQENLRTFSAYINVCEQIQRNYENCELAKLIIGIK